MDTPSKAGTIRPSSFFQKLTYDELGTILELMESVDLQPEEVLVREKVVRIRSLMTSKRALEDAQDKAIKKERHRRDPQER
jgi:hypothetical protein